MSKIKNLFSILKDKIEAKVGDLTQDQVDTILEKQYLEDAAIFCKVITILEEETVQGNSLIHLAVINNKPNWLRGILNMVETNSEKIQNPFSPSNYIRKVKEVSGVKKLPNKIVNLVNKSRKTCLHLAIERNYCEHVKILISFHVGLNLLCERNLSALTCAVEKGYYKIVKLLLKAGADPNIKGGIFQSTPLHSACITGNLRIVEMLIKFQADFKAIDSLGRTILYFAKIYDRSEIVSILEKKIGKISDNFNAGYLSSEYIVITEEEKKMEEMSDDGKAADFHHKMKFSQDRQVAYLENKTLEETKDDLKRSLGKLKIEKEKLNKIEKSDFFEDLEDPESFQEIRPKPYRLFEKNICSRSF